MTTNQSPPTCYLIQEKHLSLHNRFTITDNSGVVHYKVNSTFFAMGNKLLFSDADGNALMKIRQDKLHLHLRYKIFSIHSGVIEREIASIKRIGPLRQHKLEISSSNGEYILQRKGGVSSNEFTLTKDDDIVAIATKDVSPTKSLYWVDIIDSREDNHAFVLAMIIVLACAQRLPSNPVSKPVANEAKSD